MNDVGGHFNTSFGTTSVNQPRIRYPTYLRRVAPPSSTFNVHDALYPRQFKVRRKASAAHANLQIIEKYPIKHISFSGVENTTAHIRRKSFKKKKRRPQTLVPVGETPAKTIPVEDTPAEETPVEETPVVETPVEKTLAVQTLVEKTLAAETPVKKTLAVEKPVEKTRVVETPVEETLAVEKPVEETLVVETPVEKIMAVETPVEETRVVETPVEETLAVEKPVEKTLVVETPVEKTLAVEKPVEKTLAVEMPVEKTRVLETPVEETLAVEKPVEKNLVVETPVEETLVVNTPPLDDLVRSETDHSVVKEITKVSTEYNPHEYPPPPLLTPKDDVQQYAPLPHPFNPQQTGEDNVHQCFPLPPHPAGEDFYLKDHYDPRTVTNVHQDLPAPPMFFLPPPPPPTSLLPLQTSRVSAGNDGDGDGILDQLERFKLTAKEFERECLRRRRFATIQDEKIQAKTIAEQAKNIMMSAKRGWANYSDDNNPKTMTMDDKDDDRPGRRQYEASKYAELEQLGLGKYDSGGRWVPNSKNNLKNRLKYFQ